MPYQQNFTMSSKAGAAAIGGGGGGLKPQASSNPHPSIYSQLISQGHQKLTRVPNGTQQMQVKPIRESWGKDQQPEFMLASFGEHKNTKKEEEDVDVVATYQVDLTKDFPPQKKSKHTMLVPAESKHDVSFSRQEKRFSAISDNNNSSLLMNEVTAQDIAAVSASSMKTYGKPVGEQSRRKSTSRNNLTRFSLTMSGQTQKSFLDGSQRLGPGQYDISREIGKDAPKITLKGKIEQKITNTNPGPGEYKPIDTLSRERVKTPIMRDGERFRDANSRKDSPGPGTYYKDEYFARKASPITLKGKARDPSPKELPGPGAYDPTLEAIRTAIRNIKLSSSARPIDFQNFQDRSTRNDIPGPGSYTYHQKSIGKDVPSITIKARLREPSNPKNSIPGPGAYQERRSPSPTVKIVPGERFKGTQSKRSQLALGPGQYDQTFKNIGTDGPKFSLGGKSFQKIRDDSPGPGAYDVKLDASRSRSPSITLKGKLPDLSLSQSKLIPGPGQYQDHHSIGKGAPQMSIHGRIESKSSMSFLVPGPGTYNANVKITRPSVLTPNLSSSQRGQRDNNLGTDSPGPGAYEEHNVIGANAPKITLKPRLERSVSSESPGPGHYRPNDALTKPSLLGPSFRATPHAIDSLRRISIMTGSTTSNKHHKSNMQHNYHHREKSKSATQRESTQFVLSIKTLPTTVKGIDKMRIEDQKFQHGGGGGVVHTQKKSVGIKNQNGEERPTSQV